MEILLFTLLKSLRSFVKIRFAGSRPLAGRSSSRHSSPGCHTHPHDGTSSSTPQLVVEKGLSASKPTSSSKITRREFTQLSSTPPNPCLLLSSFAENPPFYRCPYGVIMSPVRLSNNTTAINKSAKCVNMMMSTFVLAYFFACCFSSP